MTLKDKDTISDLGGNASIMALRAYQEGCTVLLGGALDDHFYAKLFNRDIEVSMLMDSIGDKHICFDYYDDQTWGAVTPSRSNRFYFNRDQLNKNLNHVAEFHQKEQTF